MVVDVRPVARQSLVEQAAAELARLLAAGHWPIGTRLPGEVELGRLLGGGRSTVREAVRSLAAVGMVEARQGAGTFVASASPLTPLDRRLRRAGVAEAYEVRMAPELEAARLAAARHTDADLAALQAALAARAAASSPAEFVDADLVFHHAVIAAAHNPVLAELFTHFATALRAALLDLSADTALRSPADRAAATDAHHDLAAAIAAGDGAAAVDATRRNVETTLLQLRGA